MPDNIIRRLAVVSSAALVLAACSTGTDTAAPTTSGTPTATAAASPSASPTSCEVNPSSAPVPTAGPYETVPAADRISVSLSGIPSGSVQPGAAPVEVEVTLCNNSPVDYPKIGTVLVLEHCSCATNPVAIPEGTIERFDAATNTWIKLDHPAAGTGMDYLGGYTDVQELPKGKSVTLKYRVALDASMVDGQGGLEAVAVTPEPLNEIGKDNLPFTVTKTPAAPTTPNPKQSVVPLNGLTNPFSVTVDPAGNIYVVDQSKVVKLAAGSNDQSDIPFAGLTQPGGLAVDKDGNVYVTDEKKVLKWTAATNQQEVLPFTGLDNPQHLAVDKDGDVYVADGNRVVGLMGGLNIQAVLPFTDLTWIRAVAVDGDNNVYVNDGANKRVVKLPFNTTDQIVVPLTGVDEPDGLAVDKAGDLYVVDATTRQVKKVAAGSGDGSTLGFAGLNGPTDVTVDAAGNVYVLDSNGFGELVKLAA